MDQLPGLINNILPVLSVTLGPRWNGMAVRADVVWLGWLLQNNYFHVPDSGWERGRDGLLCFCVHCSSSSSSQYLGRLARTRRHPGPVFLNGAHYFYSSLGSLLFFPHLFIFHPFPYLTKKYIQNRKAANAL